jgi:hypothetical protein
MLLKMQKSLKNGAVRILSHFRACEMRTNTQSQGIFDQPGSEFIPERSGTAIAQVCADACCGRAALQPHRPLQVS